MNYTNVLAPILISHSVAFSRFYDFQFLFAIYECWFYSFYHLNESEDGWNGITIAWRICRG